MSIYTRVYLHIIWVGIRIPMLWMSVYSKVTEQDLISLRKFWQQQKNQRALKFKNRISKQTHDTKLPEGLSPITKKLDGGNESTQKIGDVINEPNFKM